MVSAGAGVAGNFGLRIICGLERHRQRLGRSPQRVRGAAPDAVRVEAGAPGVAHRRARLTLAARIASFIAACSFLFIATLYLASAGYQRRGPNSADRACATMPSMPAAIDTCSGHPVASMGG